MTPSVRRGRLGLLLAGTVVVAGLWLSPTATAGVVETLAADSLAFAAFVGALYLVRPAFAWPTTALAVVVGYGFGPVPGVPIALVGVLVTVVPPYAVTRWVVDDPIGPGVTDGDAEPDSPTDDAGTWVERPLQRAESALVGYFGATGPFRGVVVARLLPIPSDVATVGAAAAGVPPGRFLAGTAVGEFPWTVAAVTVGASAATLTTTGVGSVGWQVTLACVLAAAALLAGPAYRLATGRPLVETVIGTDTRNRETDGEVEAEA